MRKSERLGLAALAALSLMLRALAYFRYRFDSDEPQHLHVTWGWTAGLVQYRDLFDNHTPLFHIATAPILAALGERADILLYMRAPMLLLFGVVLACTYLLARERRTALWAVVLLSLFPPFFLKSLEYRTDNLWNALVMIAVAIVALAPRRMFVAGVITGAAFSTSMKTTVVVMALALASATLLAFQRRRPNWSGVATFMIGTAIVPTILALYFASQNAWDDLVYCVFTFNELVMQTRPGAAIVRAAFPLLVALIIWMAWRAHNRGATKLFLPLFAAMYLAIVVAFWVLVTPRDFLPLMPLLAIFAATRIQRAAVLATIALVCAASLWYYADKFENRTDEHITMMNQVLGMSRPGEPLMDYKGETIYRRRPYYPIFEAITRAAMKRGLITDTVFEDVVRANCTIAQADGPFWPPRSRALMSANFLDMGRIRAAGQWIEDDGTFTIAIPGLYSIVDDNGETPGTLDGIRYGGSRYLGAGGHRFVKERDTRIAVVWAPALERGYSPFHLRDREF